MPRRSLTRLYRDEFTGYSLARFQQDLLAGLIMDDIHALILSMRGVPLIDTSGIEAIHRLHERVDRQGGTLMFAGVHDSARTMMDRGGLVRAIGGHNFFWSSDQAIVEAETRGCGFC